MIKAAKKLKKLWPRKKKRNKSFQHSFYYLPPPPLPPPLPQPHHFHCCSCSQSSPPPPPPVVQPSAPPLPPWLEADRSISSVPELGHQKYQFPCEEEIVVETNPQPLLSYQQYTVSSPVYGVPAEQAKTRQKSGWFFGFVVKFGANLIRCFCPCFHIREID